jgi:hypothetical protein
MNNERMLMKFDLLALVIAIALAATMALSSCAPIPAGVSAAPNSLQGVWFTSVSPQGEPPFSNLSAFHSDGTVAMNENDGRIGVGVWEKVSNHSYAFTVWEYWQDGETYFQAKVSSSPIDLGTGGDEYSGPFTFQVFVVGNPNPVVEGSGTATGVRMHVK